MHPNRVRALRAAAAVAFGGLFVSACGTTAVNEPDAGTDASDTGGGDTTQPDTTQPDATQPDATQPDTTQPDATQPDATQPDATQPDVPEPDVPEPDVDVPPVCSDEQDDVCPEGCTPDNDYDCCVAGNGDFEWCNYTPEWGCGCAVEGPFAPPTPSRSRRPRFPGLTGSR